MPECEVCGAELDEFEIIHYKKHCLWHCDKADTADIKWSDSNEVHVKIFWDGIRKQIAQATDSLDFSGYQFPAFEFQVPAKGYSGAMTISKTANFWELPEGALLVEIRFDKEIDFTNAIFRYKTDFSSVSFNEKAIFKNAKFYGCATFSSTVFEQEIDFSDAEFLDEVLFNAAIFKSEYYFLNCIFNDAVFLDGLSSYDENRFGKAVFNGDTRIFATQDSPMLIFKNITFAGSLSLLGIKNGSIAFYNTTFNSFVVLQAVGIINSIKFDNVILSDKAIFGIQDTKCGIFIYENIRNVAGRFELVNFEILDSFIVKNSSLRNTDFIGLDISKSKNVVDNVSFTGAHFANVKWGEINENRFVDVNNKPFDRQMARQLKSINDAQGETVIANDFYVLEMRLRSKELNWREHFGEKLVQNIHGFVSNHSNDWALPTIWFLSFGFLFSSIALRPDWDILFGLMAFFALAFGVKYADEISLKETYVFAGLFFILSIVFFSVTYPDISYLVAFVNPLGHKESHYLLEHISLFWLYFGRLVEMFIGYQIITAIRKNTRRK